MPQPFYHATAACAGGLFDLDLARSLPWRAAPKPHWHSAHQINFVRAGRGEFVVGDCRYAMKPGAVFVVPAGVPHFTEADPAEPHWTLTLYLRSDSVLELGDAAVDVVADTTRTVRCLRSDACADLWENVFSGLACERRLGGGYRAAPTAAAKLLDACLLVRRCADAAPSSGGVHAADACARLGYARRMLAFIDGHLGERLSLRRIAADVGLSPTYASEVFHSVTGTPLFAYIAARRLRQARELLAHSALPVEDVARRCGFASTPTFYRRFRAEFGRTPASLRPRSGDAARPTAVRRRPTGSEPRSPGV